MDFVTEIYQITKNFPADELHALSVQLRRCAVSIPFNIAEGCVRFSDKDTKKFIDIALGSIAELDTQLILADDLGFAEYNMELANLVGKVSALLQGLKKYVDTD